MKDVLAGLLILVGFDLFWISAGASYLKMGGK